MRAAVGAFARIFPSPAVLYLFTIATFSALSFILAFVSGSGEAGILPAFILGLVFFIEAFRILFSRSAEEISRSPFRFIGFPLFAIGSISALSAETGIFGWWGESFEFGTVGFLFLFSCAVYAGSAVPIRVARWFLSTYVWATILMGFVTVTAYSFFSKSISFNILSDAWTELSLGLGAGLVVAVVLCDRDVPDRIFIWANAALLSALGFVSLLSSDIMLALILSLALSTGYLLLDRSLNSTRRFPFFTSAALLLLVVLWLIGVRNPPLQMPSDVRPALLLTELTVAPEYLESVPNILVGSGPRSFPLILERHRPIELNSTPLWNASPSSAYSAVLTFAAEIGVVGVCAFLLLPLVLFSLMRRAREIPNPKQEVYALFLASAALALYGFVAASLYPVGIALFLVSGAALGISAAMFSGPPGFQVQWHWLGRSIAASIYLSVSGILLFVSLHQFFASVSYVSGTRLLKEDSRSALIALESAADTWRIPRYEKAVAHEEFQAVFSKDATSSEVVKERLIKAVLYATRASDSRPADYSNLIFNASLHVSLLSDGLTASAGSSTIARTSLEIASRLGRVRPETPYFSAVLAYLLKDFSGARYFLEESLILKPDYAPSLEFKKRLEGLPSQN